MHMLVATLMLLAGMQDSITDGADVLRAMHQQYAGKWYENLALCQTVTYYDIESGAFDSARVWYESIQLPGMVRSDIAPLDAGNREMFLKDRWVRIQGDTVVRSFPGPHPLLLLGFDVYVQPVETSIAALDQFGVDLSKMREDEWQGMKMYVVGSSSPDDTESRQFWVDQENLLFHRLLFKSAQANAQREIQFAAYEELGGGWIATEVVFMTDGRTTLHERYNYWDIGFTFEPGLFAAEDRSRPAWVKN